MDYAEANKVYAQFEAKADVIEIGQSLKNISNGYGSGKCFSCRHGWIMRVARQNEPIVRCQMGGGDFGSPMIVPHDVTECSKYDRKGELDIMTLIQMHNPVDLSKPDKVVGFSKKDDDDASTETGNV